MPPVVQGRRAPGPADAARFGVDWVRLGLGLASISVLLSQDCPRLRGIFPLRNGRSGRSALGCRFGLPFPRRLPGFPLRVPAWAGCRFGRIRGRPVRRDGPIQPHNHCTPARRRGQALFVRPPPFFPDKAAEGNRARGPAEKSAAGRRRRTSGKTLSVSVVDQGPPVAASSFPNALFPLQKLSYAATAALIPPPPASHMPFCKPSRTVGSLAFTTAPAPVWHTTPCPFESNRSGWQLQKPACKFSHLFYYGRCHEASFFVADCFSLFYPLARCFCPFPEFFRLFPLSVRSAALFLPAIAVRRFSHAAGQKARPAGHGRARLHACPRNATRHTPSRLAPRAFPHSVGQANNSASGPSGTGAANSHSLPSSRRTGTPRAASAARNGSGPSSGKVSRSVR